MYEKWIQDILDAIGLTKPSKQDLSFLTDLHSAGLIVGEDECPNCGGQGWCEVMIYGHAPDCDGTCQNCPVPERGQEQCEYCHGSGKINIDKSRIAELEGHLKTITKDATNALEAQTCVIHDNNDLLSTNACLTKRIERYKEDAETRESTNARLVTEIEQLKGTITELRTLRGES